ncbi:hypothetical protein TNCV_285961 [Trichonephila clavipes]|nr:hypothetical protein TNCV_285961 [Trichonephila clavipes]
MESSSGQSLIPTNLGRADEEMTPQGRGGITKRISVLLYLIGWIWILRPKDQTSGSGSTATQSPDLSFPKEFRKGLGR